MSPISAETLSEVLRDPLQAAALQALNPQSVIFVPLRRGTRRLGVMSLVSCSRRYEAQDTRIADEIAFQAAIAVDNTLLYQQAQNAVSSREHVLAVVSHDLRNPSGAISLNAELLEARLRRANKDTSMINKSIQAIASAASRMNGLIDDLLDISSIQAGRLAITSAAFSLQGLAEEAHEMFRHQAALRDVALDLRVQPGLPAAHCDKRRILQVLGNLLDNALKLTPAQSTVRIEASAVAFELHMSVVDTGPGIPADELAQVFERFWRGKERYYRGSGLGLAIAQSIVTAHRGRIWVESVVGQGSRFTFTLPCAPPQAAVLAR